MAFEVAVAVVVVVAAVVVVGVADLDLVSGMVEMLYLASCFAERLFKRY